MWLGIHGSYKYIQSFQVGVVRYAQSDSKQLVSYISKRNLSMKIILSLWLGTLKADSIHSYVRGQAPPGVPKVIPIIKISICQN